MNHKIIKLIQPDIPVFFELTINNNTEPYDNVELLVKFNGSRRPTVKVKLSGVSETVREARKTEFDMELLLPEKPYQETESGVPNGEKDWPSYIEHILGPEIKRTCKSSNRNFVYTVLD